VAAAHVNPLDHYTFGWHEGRDVMRGTDDQHGHLVCRVAGQLSRNLFRISFRPVHHPAGAQRQVPIKSPDRFDQT